MESIHYWHCNSSGDGWARLCGEAAPLWVPVPAPKASCLPLPSSGFTILCWVMLCQGWPSAQGQQAGRIQGVPVGWGQGDPCPGVLVMWFVLLVLCSVPWELSLLCPALAWVWKGSDAGEWMNFGKARAVELFLSCCWALLGSCLTQSRFVIQKREAWSCRSYRGHRGPARGQ